MGRDIRHQNDMQETEKYNVPNKQLERMIGNSNIPNAKQKKGNTTPEKTVTGDRIGSNCLLK